MRCALLAIAFCASATLAAEPAASQPPPPSGTKASSPQQANSAKPDSQTEAPQSNAGRPATVNIFGPQQTQTTARHEAKEGHEESSWKGVWEALIALGTLALAAITGILAWYTYGLWSEAVKAREKAIADSIEGKKETREALDIARQTAEASAKIAATAESTAQSAQDSVLVMRNTAIRQLRAYVWHEIGEHPSIDEDRICVNVVLKNAGSTPAHQTHCWMKIRLIDEDKEATYKFESAPLEIDGPRFVINPSSTHTNGGWIKTTEEERRDYRYGAKFLYVWGEVRYVDAFKEKRWSKFRLTWRYVSEDKAIWTYCAEGNEDDDN